MNSELSSSAEETKRQSRVLGQVLSMHTVLRDRFEFNALLLDIILIASSVVFCATTFVRQAVGEKGAS